MMRYLTDADLVANFELLLQRPGYLANRIAEFGRFVSFDTATVYRITDEGKLVEVQGDTLPDE